MSMHLTEKMFTNIVKYSKPNLIMFFIKTCKVKWKKIS